DVMIFALPLLLGFHVVGIVKNDAVFLHRADVVLVGMLIKGEQDVGFIAGAEDFAGANADLKDGGSARDSGGNGHESHDFLFTATGQAREKAADGLNAVLGIARDPDDGFGNLGNFGRTTR